MQNQTAMFLKVFMFLHAFLKKGSRYSSMKRRPAKRMPSLTPLASPWRQLQEIPRGKDGLSPALLGEMFLSSPKGSQAIRQSRHYGRMVFY